LQPLNANGDFEAMVRAISITPSNCSRDGKQRSTSRRASSLAHVASRGDIDRRAVTAANTGSYSAQCC